jgi:nucleotide-binding universal stress UspA family protein
MTDTIVVGYEGKDGSERVLDAAIAAVRESGGKLVVAVAEYLPVDPGMPSMVYDVSGSAVPLPAPDQPIPPALEPIIERAKQHIEAAGLAAQYVWGVGDPARLIVETANELSAAKIVIGATSHGFFGRLLGDDNEAEVKREATCEVVVVD